MVRQALAEDVGTGDATTTSIVPQGTPGKPRYCAREPLVCAGLPLVENVFERSIREMRVGCSQRWILRGAGAELMSWRARPQAILTGERTALYFLAHLCGLGR